MIFARGRSSSCCAAALGASLQAIRDDEEAAALARRARRRGASGSSSCSRRVGCGAAGALTLANTLFIEPTSIFSVQYTAYMIFMVLVGGLGTFEGPIIGAIVLFVIQTEFAPTAPWYLVGLGATAILFALFLPRGLWGTVTDRFGIQLLPVGRELVVSEEPAQEPEP